mmetsp:Transcript_98354/g.212069  ORF Transcript_98354/g.212069 Transcript_98354/m.212069 type:complete len:234 (-) Transcript_98354:677-1378(-)
MFIVCSSFKILLEFLTEFRNVDRAVVVFIHVFKDFLEFSGVEDYVLGGEELLEFLEVHLARVVFVDDVEEQFGCHELVGFVELGTAGDELALLDLAVVVQVQAAHHHLDFTFAELLLAHECKELLLLEHPIFIGVHLHEVFAQVAQGSVVLDLGHAHLDGFRKQIGFLLLRNVADQILANGELFLAHVILLLEPWFLDCVLEFDALVGVFLQEKCDEVLGFLAHILEFVVVKS